MELLDIGSYIDAFHGDYGVTGVAAGAGDNTEADGEYVAVPADAQSAAMVIVWTATLTDTETFSLAANAQDATSAAGAGVADFKATAAEGADGAGKQTLTAGVVVTSDGGGAENGVTVIRFPDIRSHRGFLRSQVTGDLSAGATDTFAYAVLWIFGIGNVPKDGITNVN